jgi:3-oxoacyl-[acyl-carrier-protein] synthase-3
MFRISAAIATVQGCVPPNMPNNFELETMVETTGEWIRARTGLEMRHNLKGQGRGTSVMGAEAVRGLPAKRGLPKSTC